MDTLKDKITFYVAVMSFAAVLAGYGIWVGRISNRVDQLEDRTSKIETTIDSKIDSMAKTISDLTVQTAVLTEKVDQLRMEVKNAK